MNWETAKIVISMVTNVTELKFTDTYKSESIAHAL